MYHASMPFVKPPKGFLKVSNLEVVELEPNQPFGEVLQCNRCGKSEIASHVGRYLLTFVCDSCRNDDQEWQYKGSDYTIEEMESQSPDIRLEGFYKRTNV